MKKIILAALALFILSSTYSQTEKGRKFIGGQISCGRSNTEEADTIKIRLQKAYNIGFAPRFGFFIDTNFSIGAGIFVNYQKSTDEAGLVDPSFYNNPSVYVYCDTSITEDLEFGIDLFSSYYCKIIDRLYFVTTATASFSRKVNYYDSKRGYNIPSTMTDRVQREYVSNIFEAGIQPGLEYFIGSKLSLQLNFGKLYYRYATKNNTKSADENLEKSHNLDFTLSGNSLNFGLSYYF